MERRQKVDNRSQKLLMVFTEPEAQDYWLAPGEAIEIRASILDSDAMFELCLHEDGIIVFPSEPMGHLSVWQGNTELTCGHKRPIEWGQP